VAVVSLSQSSITSSRENTAKDNSLESCSLRPCPCVIELEMDKTKRWCANRKNLQYRQMNNCVQCSTEVMWTGASALIQWLLLSLLLRKSNASTDTSKRGISEVLLSLSTAAEETREERHNLWVLDRLRPWLSSRLRLPNEDVDEEWLSVSSLSLRCSGFRRGTWAASVSLSSDSVSSLSTHHSITGKAMDCSTGWVASIRSPISKEARSFFVAGIIGVRGCHVFCRRAYS